MRSPEGAKNHFQATQSSYELHRNAIAQITSPTLIIHGDCDPVFPIDHAQALHQAIPQSKLDIVPGLGHGISARSFFMPIIEKIEQHMNGTCLKN